MSCWRKRRKRTVEQERAFQEQARKVALENGKRLGESPPTPLRCFPPTHPSKIIGASVPNDARSTGMCCFDLV